MIQNLIKPILTIKNLAFLSVVALFTLGCSEEKREPLPDLPPIELPKDVPGLYSGSMPCDNCKTNAIRMTLNEDHSVVIVQALVMDTIVMDTLNGTYEIESDVVKVSLSNNSIHWNFKRSPSGTLSYLTSAGTPYQNADGMPADLIRIFKPMKLRPANDSNAAKLNKE